MGQEGCHRLRCARGGARTSFLPGPGTRTRRKQVNNLATAASEHALPGSRLLESLGNRTGHVVGCRERAYYVCTGLLIPEAGKISTGLNGTTQQHLSSHTES